MTTTVTITTNDWPVEATVTDDYDRGDDHLYATLTTKVLPNTSRTFQLTSTRSVAFRELPIPHVADTPAIDQVDVDQDEVAHRQV
jgi:hypothetical protein